MKPSLLRLLILPLLLLAIPARAQSSSDLVINEVDADTPGSDAAEFVELYNRGTTAITLDEYVLVLYNGNGDASYLAIDLDGHSIAPGGYFLLGNAALTDAAITFPDNTLQNGADAVALYQDSAAVFPNGTAVTNTNLVDAVVYGTADPDDAELLAALGQTTQHDEAANGDKDNQSTQRSPDGADTFVVAAPTPQHGGGAVDPLINEFDADTPGTDDREFVELYNPGSTPLALDEYVLVFYNGSNDAAYFALDLDGLTIEPESFLLVGNPAVTGAGLTFPNNTLQNGADALALYRDAANDFPVGRVVTSTNLVDAFVYGTDDPDDAELLAGLGETVQYNEAANGDKDNHSVQRVPAGSETIVVTGATPQAGSGIGAALAFSAAEYSAAEGDLLTVTVQLVRATGDGLSADVVLAAGSSAERLDLDGFDTVAVAFDTSAVEGDTRQIIIPIDDDAELEGLEHAVLTLTNVQGGSAEGPESTAILIVDNDVTVAGQTVLFPGVTGEALVDSLRANFSPDQTLGYDVARDTMYAVVDAREGGFVVDVYTGRIVWLDPASDPTTYLAAQGINAEHVFPQSFGVADEPERSDLHNLFPSDADANSRRGNSPFDELADASVSDWLYRGARYDMPLATTDVDLYSESVTGAFEPKEAFKGDAARALFYMAAIYADSVDQGFLTPQFGTLLAWNTSDPADTLEVLRTGAIEAYQGNVNPFVLDSTLAGRIWSAAPPPEVVTIAEARTRDGETVVIEGVLNTPDYGFNNGQFFVQDSTGGINVFSPTVGGNNRNTPFAAGDSVRITGTIGAFSDQVQITLEDHTILSSGNPVPEPVVVDRDSFTVTSPLQGMRVAVEQVTLTEESEWPTTAQTTGSGATVFFTNESREDTFAVFIDRDESFYDGTPRPEGYFDVAGTLARFGDLPEIYLFFESDLTSVADPVATEDGAILPSEFALLGNFPNPASRTTHIGFDLPSGAAVVLTVYDLLGREVLRVDGGQMAPGARRSIQISTAGLPAALYVYRLSASTGEEVLEKSGRLMVVR